MRFGLTKNGTRILHKMCGWSLDVVLLNSTCERRTGTTGLIITCRGEMLFVSQSSVYRRILVIVPYCARLEVLTAVWMKNQMFCNLMPYRLVSYRSERTFFSITKTYRLLLLMTSLRFIVRIWRAHKCVTWTEGRFFYLNAKASDTCNNHSTLTG